MPSTMSAVKESRPAALIGDDEFAEAGLVDRRLAFAQGGDLGGVLVDADDLVTEIGEACARDQTDVAGADHRDAHRRPSPLG